MYQQTNSLSRKLFPIAGKKYDVIKHDQSFTHFQVPKPNKYNLFDPPTGTDTQTIEKD